MKLKDKLKLSFCVMILLPAVLFLVLMAGIFKIQSYTINQTYNVEGDDVLLNFYSPMMFFGSITNDAYEQLRAEAENNPEVFNDDSYLDSVAVDLNSKLSNLVVRKNNIITYNSTEYSGLQLAQVLPGYKDNDTNIMDMATYKGGDYQCIVKQLDFKDADGNYYSVSILTSVKQCIPEIKAFIAQLIFIIILILILTSLGLNLWIYSSIIRPVNRLKLATDNIKEGNLDFQMMKVPDNEIGEVCKDFEEMRVILKQNAEEKIQSDKDEKELIRNISHDLKTPLTAIKGYVEGLLDGVADTPEKQEKYIRTIANKVNDMDKLIDELTIYSRLDANRVPYTFVKMDVSDYFNDCVEEISVELDASGFDLNYRNHIKEPAIIVADPEQLKRVINNIISNSVKYKSESRKGRIDIDLYDEGQYVHIIIADNGKGIAGKDLAYIFKRFYRTDESRNSKQGGSGIGLAIVKKIVEDHKGKIWAESVEGEGTTMHLNLLKYRKEEDYEQNINS
ncbi:MAG: ATP-binding protein [Lachnospira sp.]